MRKTLVFIFIFLCIIKMDFYAQSINRKALVQRHNIIITRTDTLSALTVGNGKFAFTVDVTGLQTFPGVYENGIPLGTQSEWGWHSFPDSMGYNREEALKTYHLNGRDITYLVQWNVPQRNKAAANWFRENPHRLQLGNLGFELLKKDGLPATLSDIQNIRQELDLWTGEIKSHFTIENIPVDVSTFSHGVDDVIAFRVVSQLISEGRIKIRMKFSYPTGEWSDAGTNRARANLHQSFVLLKHSNGTVLLHELDTTKYYVRFWWNSEARVRQLRPHDFIIAPEHTTGSFEISVFFSPDKEYTSIPDYAATKISSEQEWKKFWESGGAVDFSGSTDPRAFELERRIILSQYLIKTQEAGSYPPQETGLTCNSWYGKPHLEMHWWHAAHFAMWGRTEFLEKSLNWYANVADKARQIAGRQGFDGIRWQKMVENNGDEVPSSVGAFLIWQQPHFIYFAELCYRNKRNDSTLNKYKDLVFATADFMASYPYFDKRKNRYILGKGLIPAQERYKPEETFNPTFELVYWKWALDVAQHWRERLKLGRNKKWDDVIKRLSRLPVQNNKYLFTESAVDSYSNPEYRTDHPSVFGAFGMLPSTGQVNKTIMENTFDWIWKNWSWKDTWGWDFPLTAMTATRLGMPGKAVDALLMNIQTNTYLVNGHNYQDDRLRLYLPGNGGLLAAVALMCAGFDGCRTTNPGFPKNGKWKVKWEGLKRQP